MKRDIDEIVKGRKEELMYNDIDCLSLIYKKILSGRRAEFMIINRISDILRKYISGTDIKDITQDDWFELKEILFPKNS
jgi:hypothetical protein